MKILHPSGENEKGETPVPVPFVILSSSTTGK